MAEGNNFLKHYWFISADQKENGEDITDDMYSDIKISTHQLQSARQRGNIVFCWVGGWGCTIVVFIKC